MTDIMTAMMTAMMTAIMGDSQAWACPSCEVHSPGGCLSADRAAVRLQPGRLSVCPVHICAHAPFTGFIQNHITDFIYFIFMLQTSYTCFHTIAFSMRLCYYISMNLLFFDIECAAVFSNDTAFICAFGYVLCNDRFRIISKKDILINPKVKFHLTGRKDQKDLELPYNMEVFKTCPTLKEVCPDIRALLEDKNNLVYGHAVHNDVGFLIKDFKRCGLPAPHFSFSDTQLIYMTMMNDFTAQPSLETIAEKYGIQFEAHRAVDDAYATMRILKAMCEELGCKEQDLKKRFSLTRGSTHKGETVLPSSAAYDAYKKDLAEKREARLQEKIAAMDDYEREVYENRANRSKDPKIVKARKEFYDFIKSLEEKTEGPMFGQVFSFYEELQLDMKRSERLVRRIYDLGGMYMQFVSRCTIYVEEDEGTSAHTEHAHERKKKDPGCIRILKLADLEEMLFGDSPEAVQDTLTQSTLAQGPAAQDTAEQDTAERDTDVPGNE